MQLILINQIWQKQINLPYIFLKIKKLFPEFQQIARTFSISALKKAHYCIRTNNILPISILYLCTFSNSEAFKSLIFDYHRIGAQGNKVFGIQVSPTTLELICYCKNILFTTSLNFMFLCETWLIANNEEVIQSGLLLKFNEHYVKGARIWSYSGLHFPAFGLNTERYSVSLYIQSKCGEMRTRITPNTDTFYAVDIVD